MRGRFWWWRGLDEWQQQDVLALTVNSDLWDASGKWKSPRPPTRDKPSVPPIEAPDPPQSPTAEFWDHTRSDVLHRLQLRSNLAVEIRQEFVGGL